MQAIHEEVSSTAWVNKVVEKKRISIWGIWDRGTSSTDMTTVRNNDNAESGLESVPSFPGETKRVQ